MRNCPHCQFLVADDASTCSVCHQDLAAPREHAAVGSSPFVAPGVAPGGGAAPAPGFAPPPYSGPGQAAPQPGSAWPPPPGAAFPPGQIPPPKAGLSTGKIVLIVGLVCLIPVLGIAGLFLLGTVADDRSAPGELVADELGWASHEDPEGRYVLDMPGRVVVDVVETPDVFGATPALDAATVTHPDFGASTTRLPDVVPAGQTFARLPYSTTAAERGLEETGMLDDAEVVSFDTVPGTGEMQMALEVRGTVQGDAAVMWSRLIIVGSDLYELVAVGSVEDSEQVAAILERMAETFTPT